MRFGTAPEAVRYCRRCGVKTAFRSDGNFRINAQRKSLDVWLIYKCAQCDLTWNLTVLSRVSPNSIQSAMLRGFHENDPALVSRYAFDVSLIRKNGAEPSETDIIIDGEDAGAGEPLRISLIPEHPMDVKVSAVLRKKLGLSRREFNALCETHRLRELNGRDLKKCKLSEEITVEIK